MGREMSGPMEKRDIAIENVLVLQRSASTEVGRQEKAYLSSAVDTSASMVYSIEILTLAPPPMIIQSEDTQMSQTGSI